MIESQTTPSHNPTHAPRARSIAPTFVVPNVASTARWYVEHLGFQIAGTVPGPEPWVYASLTLGTAELMLLARECAASRQHDAGRRGWDAYVRMDGVRAFYQQLRGAPFIAMELRKQAYGDWEFEVRDPNGYVIVFGGDEAIPAPQSDVSP